jgi:hypothetical protein
LVGYKPSPIKGRRIAVKKTKGKTMHLLLITPLLATDDWVAPSGAAVIVILAVLALLRGR